MWTEATKQRTAQLAAEREALEQERGRIEGERREAIERAAQLARDLDQATQQIGKLEAGLRAEMATMRKGVAKLQKRLEALKQKP